MELDQVVPLDGDADLPFKAYLVSPCFLGDPIYKSLGKPHKHYMVIGSRLILQVSTSIKHYQPITLIINNIF